MATRQAWLDAGGAGGEGVGHQGVQRYLYMHRYTDLVFTLVTSPYINTAFNIPQPKSLSCLFFSFDVSCNRCCHALLLTAMPMPPQTTQPHQGSLQPLQPLPATQPRPPYADACTEALKAWFLSRAC